MSEQWHFDGLAAQYSRYRPTYPKEAFDRLRSVVGTYETQLAPLLIDVGAGTGISTEQLRDAFGPPMRILAVEPSADMRREALASVERGRRISFVAGIAESLPIARASVSVVVAAQALQWFHRSAFFAEASRVLRREGVLAIIQNNRLWQKSTFLRQYEELLERYSPGYSRHYRAFDIVQEIQASSRFDGSDSWVGDWTSVMTVAQFIGMSKSSTKVKAAIESIGREAFEFHLLALTNAHADPTGRLPLVFRTELFTSRNRCSAAT
jgi:ubiquinone/menaquinone biosynthesis C-methylase UbiE